MDNFPAAPTVRAGGGTGMGPSIEARDANSQLRTSGELVSHQSAQVKKLESEIGRLQELQGERWLSFSEQSNLNLLHKQVAKLRGTGSQGIADNDDHDHDHDNRGRYQPKPIHGQEGLRHSILLPVIPKKRRIDNEGDDQRNGAERDMTSSPQPHHNNALLPATLVNFRAMSKEERRQVLLAVGDGISLDQAGLEDINRVARQFGLHECQGPDDKLEIQGLRRPLYPHQLLAVYFMLKRELYGEAPLGGLNADNMGLGKTVESLATMVMNPPDDHDLHEGRKSTLWLGSKSSHAQIRKAVRKFCSEEALPKVLTYNKTALTKIHGNNLDSFLQEQDIIIAGYEDLVRECSAKMIAKKGKKERMTPEQFRAENIDSFGPLVKMKFYRVILDEAHRIKDFESQRSRACFCLDTKYRWCLTEIYPYLFFLQVPGIEGPCNFSELLSEVDGRDIRLSKVLSEIMIRRNNSDTILGRQLIELPVSHRETIVVTQTREERVIYKWFLRDARASFNNRLHSNSSSRAKDGKRKKPFSIVKILRLRQLACDLSLIEYIITGKGRGGEMSIVPKMLHDLAHEAGKNAFYDMILQWYQDKEAISPSGGRNLTGTALPSQQQDNESVTNPSTSRREGPGYLQKPKLRFESRYFANLELGDGQPMILGSKMQAIKESIQKHLRDGPNDKLLIFNEFTYCSKMVGCILDEIKIKHLSYVGSISQDDRNKAIKAFEHDPDYKVMVISMKCGSEALNLTVANRVISVEPYWNRGLEDQAFGRVSRIGQTKETYLTQIIVKKTIEPKMIDLQDAKTLSIAGAGLIGLVAYDENGNIISVSDDEDSDME
ncbi:hypothetical protein E0Z10_g2094 [Xylaria hypoxylon]|uniref:Helicase C-terminal domain-containing protein n=1 Tax=Xylaria hypoxylon TaxID=37992 RepID=A0A4Z0YRR7_9PEZI|nr:hypothetical protein E0Z10_g2094 [Xylaria hypoxylon]